MEKEEIKQLIERQRTFFKQGHTLDISFRIEVLKQILSLLYEYKDKFIEALKLDFNKPPFETIETEFLMIVNECKYMIKNIKKLTKIKKVSTGLINFPSKGYILQEPYGVVLVMAPWNYPLQLSLSPLFGALAAGNTIILKPANYAKHTSKVIYDLFKEFNREELISVVLGGREENQTLLDQRFDYIFFTGSTSVGKIVLEKASKHLTPVSLELGGKSPCIVHKDAPLKISVRRIAWGKFLNAGQTCVAPDYVLVHKDIYDTFIDLLIKQVKTFYYTNNKLNDDFPHLINQKHFDKVYSLIDKSKILFGGSYDGLCLEPTILKDVTFKDKIMEEEIFGPVMPIIKYDDLDKILEYISSLEKPLSFYFFSKDKKLSISIMNKMSYGGGCINDTVMHVSSENLPFGGIGYSGMGNYHGEASFKTFSHPKSVLVKSKREIKLKYPPYTTKKIKILNKLT